MYRSPASSSPTNDVLHCSPTQSNHHTEVIKPGLPTMMGMVGVLSVFLMNCDGHKQRKHNAHVDLELCAEFCVVRMRLSNKQTLIGCELHRNTHNNDSRFTKKLGRCIITGGLGQTSNAHTTHLSLSHIRTLNPFSSNARLIFNGSTSFVSLQHSQDNKQSMPHQHQNWAVALLLRPSPQPRAS